ncbi:MAG: methyltransferase domain-containing protein, partial [Myxococcales bacterium]|nr:methyltransferase domain-containing protein [Myxococcales bacterium]
ESYALAAFALGGLDGGLDGGLEHGGGKSGVRRWAVLDVGSGSGIVSLLLASRGARVWAVERDARWWGPCERSIGESTLGSGRIELIRGDAREVELPQVDVVVCNPPWFAPDAGPASPDDHKANARTAFHGGAAELVAVGLKHAPIVCVVVPVSTGLPVVHGAKLTRTGRLGGLVLGAFTLGAGTGCVEVTVDAYGPFR